MCVYVGIDVHRKRSQVAVVVELGLTLGGPLGRSRPQRLKLPLVMRRPQMLDAARAAPR